ncbi:MULTISPECIES: DUF1015 domain-containing protein [unclassified Streptomyces]|uniref:DUF1015 domain-containing protein n=1 Tax=unclassified Streptomyces TaxID=2593676 RepID=UPI0022B68130|nr:MULTISPECIES: DUF1015 domain-containing protein [unclassified Streptomyces]MCZ7413528.1 DUF1015 domain-containing protein [Streptomyces sp. WMMC897]MCZ7430522.1 DUF1015 domain-containing protein [Streptomyces sp. WMMC1477]
MHAAGLRLRPFRGLRYAPERVSSLAAVTSPPYDVVVRPDQLHQLETADPYNIVRLILPQTDDPEERHRKAAQTLRDWEAQGILTRDEQPALYVYEQRNGETLQRGLIGALRLSPAEEGVVLPHEDVMPQVVEDRLALMRETAANLDPLLLSYRGNGTESGATAVIERAAQRPPLLATTTSDGVAHQLWAVTDPSEIAEADADLAQRHALIGDGHHRWATYLRLRDEHPGRPAWQHGLVLLVDTLRYPLQVSPIHRFLPGLSPRAAVDGLGDAFRVRPLDGPLSAALAALDETPGNAYVLSGGPGHFHLLDRPEPRLIKEAVRSDRPAAWRELDATVLHSVLLDTVWGVRDRPTDIGYLHSAEAAVTKAAQTGGSALLMRATPESTVLELAEQGVTMPRKSTSFGPKPATGLVLRTLED